MHNRIACLLIASLPLLSGCIDNVLLADRSDGGASDAPVLTDGPAMDSPSSVCAACGGATSPDCLYAPGCGAVVRVCAANTCGDAVAIQHCGCDGRTFVSGCITPDRPYLHTGACTTVADGGSSVAACQDGWELVYGTPFDATTACLDLGPTGARIPVGCIPIDRVLLGAVSCYARDDGTRRVVTAYLYPWLTDQGWRRCSQAEQMRVPPDCGAR